MKLHSATGVTFKDWLSQIFVVCIDRTHSIGTFLSLLLSPLFPYLVLTTLLSIFGILIIKFVGESPLSFQEKIDPEKSSSPLYFNLFPTIVSSNNERTKVQKLVGLFDRIVRIRRFKEETWSWKKKISQDFHFRSLKNYSLNYSDLV